MTALTICPRHLRPDPEDDCKEPSEKKHILSACRPPPKVEKIPGSCAGRHRKAGDPQDRSDQNTPLGLNVKRYSVSQVRREHADTLMYSVGMPIPGKLQPNARREHADAPTFSACRLRGSYSSFGVSAAPPAGSG